MSKNTINLPKFYFVQVITLKTILKLSKKTSVSVFLLIRLKYNKNQTLPIQFKQTIWSRKHVCSTKESAPL